MNTKLIKHLCLFFLTVSVIVFFLKVFNKRVDFPCFYLAGERFGLGHDLYIISDTWPYKYLPSAAFFFWPLSFFPYNASLVLFYILSFLSLSLTYFVLAKIMIEQKIKITFFSVVIIFLMNLKSHVYDFANLQINHFLVFFLVWSFFIFKKNPQTFLKWISAFLFSIAGVFKIIPLMLSFYFLLKRELKYFLMTIATTVLLLVLPVFKYGIHGILEQYRHYDVLMKNYHQLFSSDRLYQSLPAFVARTFEYFHNANENLMKVMLIILLIPLIFMMLKMIFTQKSADEKLDWLQYSACLIFYPLVNPVGWKHGYVFLMPGIFLVFHYIKELKLYLKKSYQFLIALFLLLSVFSSEIFIGKSLSNNKDLLSFNVISAIILLVLIFNTHNEIASNDGSLK